MPDADVEALAERLLSRLLATRETFVDETEHCGHMEAIASGAERHLHACCVHPGKLFCGDCWRDHAMLHDLPCDCCGLPAVAHMDSFEISPLVYDLGLGAGPRTVHRWLHCGAARCDFDGCVIRLDGACLRVADHAALLASAL